MVYGDIEQERDTSKLYKLTKELLGDTAGTLPQRFLLYGKIVSKPGEMVNTQLDYYIQKLEKLKEKMPETGGDPLYYLDKAMEAWEHKDERQVFTFRKITQAETLTLISGLANSQAFGHDGIDSMGLKLVAAEISGPVRHLINTSLISKKFAAKWKFGKVTPRLKDRGLDRLEVSSCTPVAVLSTVSKLVERAAQLQLLKFFEDTKQLNDSCHTYRQNMSTTTTLAEILDQLYQAAEEKKMSSMMIIDQSAAFDCIQYPSSNSSIKTREVQCRERRN